MTVNMGKIDRGVRLVVAAVLVYFAIAGTAGILSWLVLAAAAVLIVTALIGNCPAYRILRINTCGVSR